MEPSNGNRSSVSRGTHFDSELDLDLATFTRNLAIDSEDAVYVSNLKFGWCATTIRRVEGKERSADMRRF
jgi:hypothetical protein